MHNYSADRTLKSPPLVQCTEGHNVIGGQIVHMEVALHGGSANKNIGDAFLLVWKFPPEVILEDIEFCTEFGAAVVRARGPLPPTLPMTHLNPHNLPASVG